MRAHVQKAACGLRVTVLKEIALADMQYVTNALSAPPASPPPLTVHTLMWASGGPVAQRRHSINGAEAS